MNRHTLLIPFAALLLAACSATEPEVPAGVISREKFIAANVAVRTVPETAHQEQRDSALAKVGVTDRQLRAWVTAYSRQPEVLSAAWEQIAFKVDSVSGARPIPGGGPPPQASSPPPVAAGTPLPPPAVAGTPLPPPTIRDNRSVVRDDSGRIVPRRTQRRMVLPPEEQKGRKRPARPQ